jgi:hypothetical protein
MGARLGYDEQNVAPFWRRQSADSSGEARYRSRIF